jgi:hypothetical protein
MRMRHDSVETFNTIVVTILYFSTTGNMIAKIFHENHTCMVLTFQDRKGIREELESGTFIRIYELTAANDNLVNEIVARMRIEALIELKRRERSRTLSGEGDHGKT